MTESCRLDRRRPHAVHSCHGPVDACPNSCCCCTHDGKNRGEDYAEAPHRDDDAPPVASATPAAPIAAEAGFTGVSTRGSGETLSRAAVEAWEAAETWAAVLAAATGEVAAMGRTSTSIQMAESNTGTRKARGTPHPAATSATTKATEPEHHRRQDFDDVLANGRAGRGDSCIFSERNSASPMGVCRSSIHRRDSVLLCSSSSSPSGLGDFYQSAVHRRDDVLCRSSSSSSGFKIPSGPARRFIGHTCPAAAHSLTSTNPWHNDPIPIPAEEDGTVATARRSFPPSDSRHRFEFPSETAGHPTTFHPVVMVGAAAATVLARIERGDKMWSMRARSAGLAALRTHLARATGRKARDAMAARHRTAARWARGMRALEARVKRKDARRKVAAEDATTAAIFARTRQTRTGLAMLKR